jgi:CPA1 family monovalent cation:H+ antiporter
MYPASHSLNIPYTVLLATTGCLLGYSAEWGMDLQQLGVLHDFLASLNSFSISSDAVLFIFLPVLVFEAALGIDAHRLIDDIAPILSLAIIGLLISAFMVGYSLHWVSGVSLIVCLLLGAIVSATDPVAVMAIFKELQAPKRLSVLVEGESLFNDATAIVLFVILTAMLTGDSGGDIFSGIQSFLKVFLLGILAGLAIGRVFCFVENGEIPSCPDHSYPVAGLFLFHFCGALSSCFGGDVGSGFGFGSGLFWPLNPVP